MLDIILNFLGNVSPKMQKNLKSVIQESNDLAKIIKEMKKALELIGAETIKQILEESDKIIEDSPRRKKNYYIHSRREREILTTLGTIKYTRCMYQDKSTRKIVCLVDKGYNIEPYKKISRDVEEKILEEAKETSYKKAGENISEEEFVSKQTVKKIVHKTHPKKIYESYCRRYKYTI